MRRVTRCGLQRLDKHPLDISVADRAGRPRARFVMETIKTTRDEPATPPPDRVSMQSQPFATSMSLPPSAHPNTIRHRCANTCALL